MFSVIFDMDGTLLNTQRIYVPAWEFAGQKQGIEGLGKYIKFVCGMSAPLWTKYLLDRHPTLNMKSFNDDVDGYIAENHKLEYMPGARELAIYLHEKGIKTAIASGSTRECVKERLDLLGDSELFGAIVGGLDVKNGKPAPDIFLLAAEKIGAKPEDCFVLEDSVNGINAAYSAGMKAIGIPDVAVFDDEAVQKLYARADSMIAATKIFEKLLG